MAGVPVLAYQQIWMDKRSSPKTEYNSIVGTLPDATASIQQLLEVLCSIEGLASCTPVSEWAATFSSAEDNCKSYYKAIFSSLNGTYTVTLNELKNSLKASSHAAQTKQEYGLKAIRSRKRHLTVEATYTPKKAALPTSTVARKNCYPPPLRPTNMDTDVPVTESKSTEAEATGKSGRPPPIILTSATNLIQLQKQLKGMAKQSSEFRNTRNGTRVVTKDMVDYQVVKTFFETKSLSYYTFNPKTEKPIKAAIRHLPINTPAEDIADGLMDLGFDVISVRQMSTDHRWPEGYKSIASPLFLVTLPRTAKSQDIFKLPNPCDISIKAGSYTSQKHPYAVLKLPEVWSHLGQLQKSF
jgi:hypothetical protein